MKLKQVVVAAAFALASSVAMAFHCPADMKKIDDALAKNPKLTATQMADVKKCAPKEKRCTRPASIRSQSIRSPRR